MVCLPRFLILLLVVVSSKPLGTSISGISSVQYQVAFSADTVGAGVFAGGPYFCSVGELDPVACAWLPRLIVLPVLEAEAKLFADNGKIDDLANLKQHAVFLFSGKNDDVVFTGVMKKLEQMYKDWGVPNITTAFHTDAGHSFPTNDYGNPCGSTYPPFITNCNYDGAGEALQGIYGKLLAPVPPKPENIKTMNIKSYTPGQIDPSYLSMNDTLVYYEPEACDGNCTVHIALAGCLSTYEEAGLLFVEHGGYNRWAEANNIVILYPYLINSIVDPINPQGCWDWWGYTGVSTFPTKTGPQMVTLHNLVDYFRRNYD